MRRGPLLDKFLRVLRLYLSFDLRAALRDVTRLSSCHNVRNLALLVCLLDRRVGRAPQQTCSLAVFYTGSDRVKRRATIRVVDVAVLVQVGDEVSFHFKLLYEI